MKYVLGALILSLFFMVCSRQSADQQKSEHDHHDVTAVQLNHGERWEANRETTDGINNMISLIEVFQSQQSQDYAALKLSLEAEFQMIFKKCTMKGEAHDQLHNFLIPVKKELGGLSAENINELHHYLKTYSDYFK